MCAALDDTPAIKHKNPIGIAHRGKSMRDHESGQPGKAFVERLPDARFR
jgi:hypothetical protein